jgi:hypothetical protein
MANSLENTKREDVPWDELLFSRGTTQFHRMAVIYMKGNVVFEVFDTEIHGLPPYT